MSADVWADTPLAQFASDLANSLSHFLAYSMGVAETTTREMFQVSPDAGEFPREAKQAILVMLNVAIYNADADQAECEIARLLAAYRAKRVLQ